MILINVVLVLFMIAYRIFFLIGHNFGVEGKQWFDESVIQCVIIIACDI